MQKNAFHVAIIGGGLGGLCLAQGLKRRGVPFDVFERDPALDSRSQGYRLRINADGQTALKRCLSPQQFDLFVASCADDLHTTEALDVQLNQTARWVDAWRPAPTGQKIADLKADRHTLREVLMCGIADRVHFNKRLSGLGRQDDDGVCFEFSDGTRHHADLLVGADGGNSRVAALCHPELQAVDTGAVCIYGKVPSGAAASAAIAPVLRAGTSVIFDNGLAVVVDAMRFSQAGHMASSRDYLYWAMIGQRDRLAAAAEVAQCVDAVSAKWAPGLRALFAATPGEMLAMLPIRQARPPVAWPAGRVTLLGDAVHIMSPASGLGCNTALRDAELLADQLGLAHDGGQPLTQAIARYEQGMREMACMALSSSERSGGQLYDGRVG